MITAHLIKVKNIHLEKMDIVQKVPVIYFVEYEKSHPIVSIKETDPYKPGISVVSREARGFEVDGKLFYLSIEDDELRKSGVDVFKHIDGLFRYIVKLEKKSTDNEIREKMIYDLNSSFLKRLKYLFGIYSLKGE